MQATSIKKPNEKQVKFDLVPEDTVPDNNLNENQSTDHHQSIFSHDSFNQNQFDPTDAGRFSMPDFNNQAPISKPEIGDEPQRVLGLPKYEESKTHSKAKSNNKKEHIQNIQSIEELFGGEDSDRQGQLEGTLALDPDLIDDTDKDSDINQLQEIRGQLKKTKQKEGKKQAGV